MRGNSTFVAILLAVAMVVSACAGSSAPAQSSNPSSPSDVAAGNQNAQPPVANDNGGTQTAEPTAVPATQAPPEATPDPGSQPPPAGTPAPPKPSPSPSTDPSPDPGSASQSDNGATAVAHYSYSMYRARTHAVQKTDWYCVPASIQMMLNLVNGTHNGGKAGQDMYWRYAQDHSTYPVLDNGADAGGWAAALRHWNAGNYSVGIHNSLQASLQAAAKRMRATGKPVGLLVWGHHGGHAWVMTGFKSTADPKTSSSFTVTSIQAMGPLWPYGTIGGKSFDPGPREWLTYSQIKAKFTDFRQGSAPAWNGRWLTVLP